MREGVTEREAGANDLKERRKQAMWVSGARASGEKRADADTSGKNTWGMLAMPVKASESAAERARQEASEVR